MNKSDFVIMVRSSDTTGIMTSIEKTDLVVNQVLDTLQRAIPENSGLRRVRSRGRARPPRPQSAHRGKHPHSRAQGREVQAGQGTAGGGEL